MNGKLAETTVASYRRLSDERLAVESGQGDREAFATLYERYFQGIYDFATRMTRDPEAAGDIVQSTFVKAWKHLQARSNHGRIKAWLYTVARNAAIDEIRRRQREFPYQDEPGEDGETYHYTIVDSYKLSNPQAALEDKTLAELVWQSAAALRPKEYALLDLHLRQGLSADELAENLGLTKNAVYTRLSRLRESLAQSVSSALLMRRGRRECPALDQLLSDLQADEMTRRVRWAIQEHVRDCPRCQESKQRYVSPAEIFAALAPVPAAPGLQETLWLQIADQLGPAPAAIPQQPPLRRWFGQVGPYILVLSALLVPLLIIGAAGLSVWLARTSIPPVEDPDDVHSISHGIGQISDNPIVLINWSEQTNVAGYSVDWTPGAPGLPDTVADLSGEATWVTSPPLASGSWYFNLRTQGLNGDWTSTVHLGPFIIVDGTPSPTPTTPPVTETPTPTETPVSPTATSTNTPTPTETAVPPTSTPTATFTPTPTNTPTPTATFTPSPTATPDLHYIFNPLLNPASPAALDSGEDAVSITFDYLTTHPGGVRILARPFSGGFPTPNVSLSISPVYPFGEGAGSASFIVTSGETMIDQIRVQMWTANQSQLLYETAIPANYQYAEPTPEIHTVSVVDLDPDSPADLALGEDVTVSFDYITTEPDGVRIFLRPFAGGAPAANYTASGSPIYPAGNGSGSGGFTIQAGEVTVDQIRIQMWNVGQSELLFEDFIPVSYHFSALPPPDNHTVSITGLNPPSPAELIFGQDVTINFDYSTTEPGGVRIFLRPFAGGAPAGNYTASGSPVYPAGDGSDSAGFTIQSGEVTVDQIRVQMWNADQSTLLFEDFVPVSYHYKAFTGPVIPLPPVQLHP